MTSSVASPNPSPTQTDAPSPVSARKRRRVTRACDACKARKRRCNGEIPCASCLRQERDCTYEADYSRGRIPAPRPAAAPIIKAIVTPPVHSAPNGDTARPTSPSEVTISRNGQYFGPASPFSFLRRAWARLGHEDSENPAEDPNYDVSIFMIGDRRLPIVDTALGTLPVRVVTARLFRHYFDFAAPTYRFLHEQTTAQWLDKMHQWQDTGVRDPIITPVREAIVFLVLATASVHDPQGQGVEERSWYASEMHFQIAQKRLAAERGRPTVASIQARLLAALFLLNTSRLNQAWYTFGTTVQLVTALGLHRQSRRVSSADQVDDECRLRCFWSAYLLDVYLSVIQGRPALLKDNESDQDFPSLVNDEDLTKNGRTLASKDKDYIITASLNHVKLAKILKRISGAQSQVNGPRGKYLIDLAHVWNQEIDTWKTELPAYLSGAVRPSTLMPIFRRQMTVLHMAHLHTVMVANRPALLSPVSKMTDAHELIERCLKAAKEVSESVLEMASEKTMFPAHWTFQYFAFHALTIIYIWIVQFRHGRVKRPSTQSCDDKDWLKDLYALAENVQTQLAQLTKSNAPGLRYSIILEELQEETRKTLFVPERLSPATSKTSAQAPSSTISSECMHAHPVACASLVEASSSVQPTLSTAPVDAVPTSHEEAIQEQSLLNWEEPLGDPMLGGNDMLGTMAAGFPLDPDLWMQIDAFPFS